MKILFQRFLKRAAHRYIKRHQPYIIGVTGSFGKTSCRGVVHEVIQRLIPGSRISSSPKNFNSEIGLVLAIFEETSFSTGFFSLLGTATRLFFKALFGSKTYDVVLLEYGIDHPGDMDYLLSIVVPHMAIFTGLDKVHVEHFSSIDDLLAEKMKLLKAAKEIVFLPVSAEYTKQYIPQLVTDVLTFSYETNNHADISFLDYRYEHIDNKAVRAQYTIQQGGERYMSVTTNLLGKEYAGYTSLGIEIAMILVTRLGWGELASSEGELILLVDMAPGRFSVLPGICGSTLIDSTYNAAPKSMRLVIGKTIALRKELFSDKDLIYCLGDMRELGEFTEEEHRKLASIIAQSADEVYLCGPAMHTYLADELQKLGFNERRIHLYDTAKTLGQELKDILPTREKCALILFKGSQNTIRLEEAIKPVLRQSADIGILARQSSWWTKKKVMSYVVLGIGTLLMTGCSVLSGPKQSAQTSVSLSGPRACFSDMCFSMEIADEPHERQQGLMGRNALSEDAGMLFIFDTEAMNRGFWMKNTFISLDIIWLDAEQRIVHIEEQVPPCVTPTCPSYGPKEVSSQYVIELAGGTTQEISAALDTKVSIYEVAGLIE